MKDVKPAVWNFLSPSSGGERNYTNTVAADARFKAAKSREVYLEVIGFISIV